MKKYEEAAVGVSRFAVGASGGIRLYATAAFAASVWRLPGMAVGHIINLETVAELQLATSDKRIKRAAHKRSSKTKEESVNSISDDGSRMLAFCFGCWLRYLDYFGDQLKQLLLLL
eukprot:2155858-Pleurochrysis_carterae.AAC.4